MNDNDIAKALVVCNKLSLFGGQRAGRELWFQKPVEVQDEDIKQFVKDVAFLKRVIKILKSEIDCQKADIDRLQEKLCHAIGVDNTGSNWFPFD